MSTHKSLISFLTCLVTRSWGTVKNKTTTTTTTTTRATNQEIDFLKNIFIDSNAWNRLIM